jgi:hypothetical protein
MLFVEVVFEEKICFKNLVFLGRVEPFVLHYECDPSAEEILYFDICRYFKTFIYKQTISFSLYPFVMAEYEFPEGHPTVIVPDDRTVSWSGPDDNPYKGLIKCRVIPPTNLKPALLAYRSKTGTLLFPLCGQCAEQMSLARCEHTDDERSFWGCYTHAELDHALDMGYKVVEVAEVRTMTTIKFAPFHRSGTGTIGEAELTRILPTS